MKRLACAMLFMLFVFSGCSLFTVRTVNPDTGEAESVYSGTVPPFYFRWDSPSGQRQNVIFPLAYFNDAGTDCLTPLFGWMETTGPSRNFAYYCTPLVASMSERGVFDFRPFLLFSFRAVDRTLQPEARSSWDMGFWPLFWWRTPTQSAFRMNGKTGQVLFEQLSFLDFGLSAAYSQSCEYARTDRAHQRKRESACYGFLYGYERERIRRTRSRFMTEKDQRATVYFPFVYRTQTDFKVFDAADSVVMTESYFSLFPLYYDWETSGEKVAHIDGKIPEDWSAHCERVAVRDRMLFPFFRIRRAPDFLAYNVLLYAWMFRRTPEETTRAWLWLFEETRAPDYYRFSFCYGLFGYESDEKAETTLRIFFIPIRGI